MKELTKTFMMISNGAQSFDLLVYKGLMAKHLYIASQISILFVPREIGKLCMT